MLPASRQLTLLREVNDSGVVIYNSFNFSLDQCMIEINLLLLLTN